MIKLIVGTKGTGKTKTLVSQANAAGETSKGNVVFIEKGMQLQYDLATSVRLVNTEEYDIFGFEKFTGFVSGILAGNYDITHLYIDGVFKVGGKEKNYELEMTAEGLLISCPDCGASKLVSTSSFIELDEQINEEPAGVEYVEKARDAFINELTVLFEGKSRRFVRSIMAATLSSIPSFIGNTDELLAYIRHSLVSCSDKVEKGVCVKLLNDIMDAYVE